MSAASNKTSNTPANPLSGGGYPHDRVVFFSDAVFAIAITLLVIEIKVPSHEQIAALGFAGALHHLVPLLVGYLVSFLVTALFWKTHLQLWRHVTWVDSRLVWLNILQLLFVALMPFSTGLYAEYLGSNEVFSFYCLNLAAISACSYLMHRHVIRSEDLVDTLGPHETDWMRARVLIGLLVFAGCIPLAFLSPMAGRLGFLLIFLLQSAGLRHYRRKATLA